MAIIFHNDNYNCEYCIHNEICKIKEEKKEALDKLSTHIDNIVTSTDYFTLNFKCEAYQGGRGAANGYRI